MEKDSAAKVWLLTPCSRVENLDAISITIKKPFDWRIAIDSSALSNLNSIAKINKAPHKSYTPKISGNSGNGLRNFLLDEISKEAEDNDWVYFLDDDNVIHPHLYDTISANLSAKLDMIIVPQIYKSGAYRLMPPTYPDEGNVDTAMVLFRFGHIKNLRWEIEPYSADGIFAREASVNARILRTNKEASYYNYLT